MMLPQDRQSNDRASAPTHSRTCDRCGFSFVAGFIWVVDRKQLNICRDCQRVIDVAADQLAKEPADRAAVIEKLLRRLGINPRQAWSRPMSPFLVAALLGFRE
jgi:hypothetical protein